MDIDYRPRHNLYIQRDYFRLRLKSLRPGHKTRFSIVNSYAEIALAS